MKATQLADFGADQCKAGNSWAGRGAQPVWLRQKLKDGAKLEDFAVHKNAGRHNNAGGVKRRRRAKR